jgi:predicted kinase
LREQTGAVHLRSDIERKRLRGLPAGARTASAIEGGLYSTSVTRATYERLLTRALQAAAGGFVALVDAAFLQRWQRDLFRMQAARQGLPFCIIAIEAPEPVLRARIANRAAEQTDASEAGIEVLEHQLRTHEPIAADEIGEVIVHDGSRPVADLRSTATWGALARRLVPASTVFEPRGDSFADRMLQ